jgi:glycosyltransferase involved in cell wall biosynthesis
MITVAVTNFNREQLLYESIEQILDDDRVSEVVISDDASEYGLYCRVVDHYKAYPKVKIYRNEKNLDCYLNKHKAVSLASNEWVLLIDSDNVFSKEFIDKLFEFKYNRCWLTGEMLQPSWAQPHFDFRPFANQVIDKHNVSNLMPQHQFQTLLNAANNFFDRDTWLSVFDSTVDPVTSDSIYQNYRWLEAGNSIYVVPGLSYFHRVNNHSNEEKSHYMKNHRKTKPGFHESIVNKLKAMR